MTCKKLFTDQLLQPLHLLANGGLSSANGGSSCCKSVEIGDRNKIEVTQDELRRALIERARQFPGQERMVYEYFEKTPGAVAELRAPIFEEKVVDFMLSQASPTERKVSKEELFKLAEEATQA